KGSQREHGDLTKAHALVAAPAGIVAQAQDPTAIAVWAPGTWPPHAEVIYLGEYEQQEFVLLCGNTPWDGENSEVNEDEVVAHVVSPLRSVLGLMHHDNIPEGALHELVVTAVAMERWWAKTQFCSVCGGNLTSLQGGWVRECQQCSTQ